MAYAVGATDFNINELFIYLNCKKHGKWDYLEKRPATKFLRAFVDKKTR